MGGVSKEYFKLLIEELFDPNLGMFQYNPDNRLYWFNGKTYETNLSFECVGLVFGLAFYNGFFVDMPIVPAACFKILLGKELDLNDYA